MRRFFFGPNNTLAQDLFARFVGAAFSGLAVAALAMWISWSITGSLNVAELRDSLRQVQNGVRTESIKSISAAHGALGCAHDRSLSKTLTCKEGLDSLVVLLRGRAALHQTFEFEDDAQFAAAVSAAAVFQKTRDDEELTAAEREAARVDFNTEVLALIGAIASGYN